MIRGQYLPAIDTIAIDYESHLFDDPSGVVFHEQTHYFLANYTNYGAVHRILSELIAQPQKLVEDINKLQEAEVVLRKNCYAVQEGFAHLLQGRKLQEQHGDNAVKSWQHLLPPEARIAFVDLDFALKFDERMLALFTEKIGPLSMQTDLHLKVGRDNNFLLNRKNLEEYLIDPGNSPNLRLKKLRVVIEKDKTILEKNISEIAEIAGISYCSPISNKERAELITSVAKFSDNPLTVTENDITSLSTAEEVFMPSYRRMVVNDPNILSRARKSLSEDFIKKPSLFRVIFFYNNPESVRVDNKIGCFGFFGNQAVLNSSLLLPEAELVHARAATTVVDTHCFDYFRMEMRPERSFISPSIIWYKNFEDFEILLSMIKAKGLKFHCHSMAFTEKQPIWFFLIFIEGMDEIIHFFVAFNSFGAEIAKLNPEESTVSSQDLFEKYGRHINNFLHDMIGLPWKFNITEMAKDATRFLDIALKYPGGGAVRNQPCLCGSEIKYKNCHGL